MRIKLAMLDMDSQYLERIVSIFGTKYADKIEIYSFTDQERAVNALEVNKIDILLASDVFDVDVKVLPKRCGFAYLVESHDIETVKGEAAISKFQKIDLIYKQILSIFSEHSSNISEIRMVDDNCNLVIFSSPSGGTGTSSAAAACAVDAANRGKQVLYLNLETFGSAGLFFTAEGQFDLSDIIYSIKSKKVNMAMKIESCVRRDAAGVYFFAPPKVALDLMEFSTEEMIDLIRYIRLSGKFQTIIVDIDFSLDAQKLKLFQMANHLVMVGDGSEPSNCKILRAYQAMKILDESMDSAMADNIVLIYNKFSNKTGKTLENTEIKVSGGAPRFEHATGKQVLEQLAGMNLFGQLL